MRALLGHAWPGNVRELENTMHRAVLLATGDRIEADAIVLSGSPAAAGADRNGAVGAGGAAWSAAPSPTSSAT